MIRVVSEDTGTKRYLSAQEAAGELEVSLKTLYAYVSRGLIRSEAVGGKRRNRRYRAEDVRRLRDRKEQRRDPKRATEGALDWGAPVMESAITLITDGYMYYRGREAVSLSKHYCLEQVAELVWAGTTASLVPEEGKKLPELFEAAGEIGALPSGPPRQEPELVAGEPGGFSPTEGFGITLQSAALRDPAAYDLRPTAVARTGARILRVLTASATGGELDAGDTVARALQRSWVPWDRRVADLLDQALILCADHELNVSSFTARCVASAGATPYAAVVAGLAALGGIKHGGNTERVEAFLSEAQTAGDPGGAAAARLRRGEAVPGFGHHLYPDGDPRSEALFTALEASYPDSETFKLCREVAFASSELMGERANLDFALVLLRRVLCLPRGAALTLFALGRMVGWVGHAIEQYEADKIIRPRARYVGETPTET